MLLLLLSGGASSGEVVAPPGGHGFVITDAAPRLWWQRKPKAMPVDEAEQRVRRIAGTIERVASKQATATKEAKREIAKAIAPQLEQMPGFDWVSMYRAILLGLHIRRAEQDVADRTLIEAQRLHMLRDEDDLLVLLLAA
jgi:hypothetical protein